MLAKARREREQRSGADLERRPGSSGPPARLAGLRRRRLRRTRAPLPPSAIRYATGTGQVVSARARREVTMGMVILGSFVGEEDQSVYVRIRRFESEAERKRLYALVYQSDC